MSKSEIEKIKAVLSDMNKRNVSQIISPDFNEIESIVITPNDDVTSLTKALEIAVEQLQSMSFLDKECRSPEQKALKQISEILEGK